MNSTKFLVAASLCAMAIFTVSCSKSNREGAAEAVLKVSTKSASEGVSTFVPGTICLVLDATNPLSADEIEFLYAMREDEKLAKDLYTAFAVQCPANIQFAHIAAAEASHIAAIESVLSYYEIKFPALGAAGVFVDANLQNSYNALVKTTTPLACFGAMALMEESNVATYQAVLLKGGNPNIQLLLENMVRASSNHLKAAVRQVALLGGSYAPTVLDQPTFDQIINSPFEPGGMYGQKNGRGGMNGNTNSQKCGQGQGRGQGQGQAYQGTVNGAGICTGTSNGTCPGTGGSQGNVGKGYRGGR